MSMPVCPTCKKSMRPSSPFTSIEHKESGLTEQGTQFPKSIEKKEFYNYTCPDCGSKIKQANRVATYKDPKIEELIK